MGSLFIYIRCCPTFYFITIDTWYSYDIVSNWNINGENQWEGPEIKFKFSVPVSASKTRPPDHPHSTAQLVNISHFKFPQFPSNILSESNKNNKYNKNKFFCFSKKILIHQSNYTRHSIYSCINDNYLLYQKYFEKQNNHPKWNFVRHFIHTKKSVPNHCHLVKYHNFHNLI